MDVAFETRALLRQLIVRIKGCAAIGIAIGVVDLGGTLTDRDCRTSRRVVAGFDLQDAQADTAIDVANSRLPPMALVGRGGSSDILVEAPFARGPFQDRVRRAGELPIDALKKSGVSTALAVGD